MGIFSWLFGKKQAPYADTASGLATLYESFGPRDRAQTYTVYLLGLAYALKELDSHPDEKMKAALGCIYQGEFLSDELVPHIQEKIKRYAHASSALQSTGEQFNRLLALGLNFMILIFEGGHDIAVTPQVTRAFNALSIRDEDAFGAMYSELHMTAHRFGLSSELSRAFSIGIPALYIPQ